LEYQAGCGLCNAGALQDSKAGRQEYIYILLPAKFQVDTWVVQLLNRIITGNGFEIPPNAPNYGYSETIVLNEPITLLYAQPHLHVRGIDMKIEIFYPDGKSETLLSVPRYNFMWQVVYILAKPIRLPKGALIRVSAHWDNSAGNKFNPDPSQTVRWGAQSWQEMMVALLGGYVETTEHTESRQLLATESGTDSS
jgi:hypothetical protein